MCVFVSRPMKIATFLRKNDYPPKRVVHFLRERDTFRNKIMEIVEDFDEKKVTTTTVNLEIVEDFACEAKFLHFSLLIILLHFDFSHFLIFSFVSLFSFFDIFLFLNFFISFIFYFFMFFIFLFIFRIFFFFFSGLLEIRFLASIASSFFVKKLFEPLGMYLFGPSFPFFSCLYFSFFFLNLFYFSLSFNIFLKKKSFFFSFFLVFLFKYVSLLASVSELNCFLRCRCSMEM